jgi:hypothetical protein
MSDTCVSLGAIQRLRASLTAFRMYCDPLAAFKLSPQCTLAHVDACTDAQIAVRRVKLVELIP